MVNPQYWLISHYPSTEVECVASLCPGDKLPPPCGYHILKLAVGAVQCLLPCKVVVVDVDIVPLPKVYSGLKTEGDSPHSGHGNDEHSWENKM